LELGIQVNARRQCTRGKFIRENTAVLASQSGCKQGARDGVRPSKNTSDGDNAVFFRVASGFCRLCCAAALTIFAPAAFAQSGNGKPPEPQKPATDAAKADTAKEGQKKIDEIAEASRALSGPAGNPECVWLGRRVVSLLWRDDLDTAFRHLDLYDRFGCPGPHIQATFRCLVRQGNIDPKQQETLNGRVHGCWLNPNLEPAPATAAAPPAQPPAATSGGTTQR